MVIYKDENLDKDILPIFSHGIPKIIPITYDKFSTNLLDDSSFQKRNVSLMIHFLMVNIKACIIMYSDMNYNS